MFENSEEAKEWFQGQKLETKIQWVELWKESDWDELENRTGEYYDGLVNIFEEIEEARSDADNRDSVIDELQTEGFELPVAASMYEAAAKDSLGKDATYLRRNAEGPGQIKEVAKVAIAKFLGRPELYSQTDVPDHLVEPADRVLINTIARQLITSYDPIDGLKEILISEYKYTEEQADALFAPILDHMEDIERQYAYGKIINISDEVESSTTKIQQLEQEISEINKKIEKIERQAGKDMNGNYREESY